MTGRRVVVVLVLWFVVVRCAARLWFLCGLWGWAWRGCGSSAVGCSVVGEERSGEAALRLGSVLRAVGLGAGRGWRWVGRSWEGCDLAYGAGCLADAFRFDGACLLAFEGGQFAVGEVDQASPEDFYGVAGRLLRQLLGVASEASLFEPVGVGADAGCGDVERVELAAFVLELAGFREA